MSLKKTTEDYLEAMLMLKEEHGYIRSVDVAEKLSVTKPSVTYATKQLKEKKYITMDPNGSISLTASGMEIASGTYRRHKLLTEFIARLGVDRKIAETDACKIEHDLSKETFDAICNHVKQEIKEE
ncbi:MAG: metal-dependent transcriptional regulator [Spirochaetia bacterium]|jgi:Mn-dependent DtxR family transcriptional regulator|nr:metal-dependent transcriptional regulator [Spirochaetia bacterium]